MTADHGALHGDQRDPLSAAALDALEALERDATPGYWYSDSEPHPTRGTYVVYTTGGGSCVRLEAGTLADARLVAEVRDALPRMVREIRERRAAGEELVAVLEQCRTRVPDRLHRRLTAAVKRWRIS